LIKHWVRRIWAHPRPLIVLLILTLIEIMRVMSDILQNLSVKQTLPAIFLGTLLGWWLGRRHGFSILYGFIFLTFLGWLGLFVVQDSIFQELVGLIRIAGVSIWQRIMILLKMQNKGFLDQQVVVLAWQSLSQAVSVQWFQITGWLSGLLTGISRYNQLSAGFFWGCVTWALFLWSGFCLSKWDNVILGLFPIGGMLAGLINRSGQAVSDMLVFCGLSLILIAIVNYQGYKKNWIASHLDYAEDVDIDIGVASSMVIAVLLFGGFILSHVPTLNPKGIQEWSSQFRQGDELISSEPLGIKAPPVITSVFDAIISAGLPRQHLIGAGPELSKRLVMVVEILNAQNTDYERFYWRSDTYDIYNGRGWASSPLDENKQDAGIPLPQPDLQGQVQVEQLVKFSIQNEQQVRQYMGPSDIFVTGELVAVDKPILAAWRSLPKDLRGLDLFGAKITDSSYRALSRVTLTDPSQLRQAGQDYPDWVRNRYLQLPEELTSRLVDLAERFKSNIISPYDRVRQIEAALREYPYTLDLESPPPGVDIVDYFLFDLKKGYCDYYASAMVVLSRLNGIPARLVTGYASGTYDPVNHRYYISEADAHSWPEIYFPNYGWVTFEPTGGRDLLTYLSRGEINNAEAEQNLTPEWMNSFNRWESMARYLLLAGVLLTPVLLSVMVKWYTNVRKTRSLPYNIILRNYRSIYKLAKPLAVGLPAIHTAREFAASVKRSYATMKIELLVYVYESAVFSSHSPGRSEAQKAVALKRSLQKSFVLERIKGFIRRSNLKSNHLDEGS
jgi:transglutaminase-like putative cysteine protease